MLARDSDSEAIESSQSSKSRNRSSSRDVCSSSVGSISLDWMRVYNDIDEADQFIKMVLSKNSRITY